MADLAVISDADHELKKKFHDKLVVNFDLDRTLVSFQANKTEYEHRWCKYKEGFSAQLIRYLIRKMEIASGRILDPFAGSGTALFVASESGLDATGIELLPSSAEIVEVRKVILDADRTQLARSINRFREKTAWEKAGQRRQFPHLPITTGAYPPETLKALERYLFEAESVGDQTVARVLRFAALCVLESISYTRKDGQYLRWDRRSGRRQGNRPFDKGKIYGFTEAIIQKLQQIVNDITPTGKLFNEEQSGGEIQLLHGSCLDVLPTLKANSFNGLITSPPYCNRYDYTRTYALELALLGVDEDHIKHLRQTMLSCTVENKAKSGLKEQFSRTRFRRAIDAFESQELLQLILEYLEQRRENGEINNTGIPRMVRNYFLESALVIADCARILKPGAPFVMVNDNVRYEGAHIPVDLVLSDFAEQAGFEVETIWVLPKGKGNSSQQMGKHGRSELRKCVYVWRLPKAKRAKQPSRQAVLER